MAKKKRKLRVDRLVLMILLSILLVIILIFAVKALFDLFSDDKPISNNPEIVEPINNSKLIVELLDYKVYEDSQNELGFNFVVAKLKFSDENNINYDLNNLLTDEMIKLNDILDYQKKMKINSYDYEKLDTTIDIKSDDNELEANIFIPYSKQKDILIITEKISGNSFSIDLSKNKEDINSIKYVSTSEEIKTASYEFKVSDNYISTMMKHNGEPYDSSMLSVYTYNLTVEQINDGIKIVDAKFKQASTGSTWSALDASYSSSKIENIINKDLHVGDKYALFFEVYSNDNEKPTYDGDITIYFSDNSSVTIKATLN